MRRWRRRLSLAAALLALAATPARAAITSCAGIAPKDALARLCAALEWRAPATLQGHVTLTLRPGGHHAEVDFGGQAVAVDLIHEVIAAAASGSAVPADDGSALRAGDLDALTLSHLVVETPLRIEDVTLDLSLKLAHATFAPPAKAGADAPCPAVIVNYADLKQLELIGSRVCRAQITNSTIAHGLKIRQDPGERAVKPRLDALLLIKSRIGTEVSIAGMQVGDLEIDRAELDALTLRDNELRGPVRINRNRMGSLQSWSDSFGGPLIVSANRVAASIDLLVADFGDHGAPQIRDNDVGGRLFLTFEPLSGAERRAIDLSYNRVAHDSNVWLPLESAPLDLSLAAGRFESALRICYARPIERDTGTTMQPVPPQMLGKGKQEAGCVAKEGMTDVSLTLTAAEVGAMGMMLPSTAPVTWQAAGFRYRHWGVDDAIAERAWSQPGATANRCVELRPETPEAICTGAGSSGNTSDGLYDLRTSLAAAGKGDALLNMANYFKAHGAFLESRLSLLRAKLANYLTAIESAVTPSLSSLVEAMFALLAMVLLAPVGYGAFPEFALLLLMIVWLAGYLWYDGYRERLEARWASVRSEIQASRENPEGYSNVAGFMQFDKDRLPREFSLLVYSADAVLPVIDLHAYGEYFPAERRWIPGVQHVCGWVLVSVFLASMTIL